LILRHRGERGGMPIRRNALSCGLDSQSQSNSLGRRGQAS
jgi:hypothetical protein